jgi:hypothetical protein
LTVYQWGFTLRDAEGYTGQIKGYVSSATDATAISEAHAIATAGLALSNAALVGRTGILSEVLDPDVYGAAADYLSVTFRAEFRFITALGSQTVIGIPSPKRSIFMADGQTVDEGNTDVATFISAVLGEVACTKNGDLLTGSLRGKLLKRAFRRKETLWSFAADLTVPDE